MNKRMIRPIWILPSLLLTLPAAWLAGAGFSLSEQSAAGLGNGFAGGAAAAEDVSTIFYNPAGLARFTTAQAQSGITAILPQAKFENRGSQTATGTPLAGPTSGANSNGGVSALVPNLYYSHPLGADFVVGLGLHAPFGLTTEYDDHWVGRYVGLKSALMTVNFNPCLAWRINEQLSIGVGASVQYIDAELSSAIDYGLIAANIAAGVNSKANATLISPATFLPGSADGKLVMKGDDFGFGFNGGVLYEVSASTRFGLHYRSSIKHTLEGDADFTVPSAVADYKIPVLGAPLLAAGGLDFSDQAAQVQLRLPETISLSGFSALDDRWEIMGDITWTRWSRFSELVLDYANPATPNSVIPERWEDVFRYSAGLNYRLDEQWKLRAGLVFDQSPIFEDRYRSPRIPDEDRWWIALGVSYRAGDHLTLEAGYVHIFFMDTAIDNPTHTAGQYLRGQIDSAADLFSLGGTWHF